MRTASIIAIVALLGAAPVAAQQGHAHDDIAMRSDNMRGMEHCMAMMGGGSSPQMLLQHRDELGLTADQVRRIEQLGAQTQQSVVPHMQSAMEARSSAAALIRSDSPDLAAYETMLRQAADHMVMAHTTSARIGLQARDILTMDQQARLQDLVDEMGGMHSMVGDGQHMMGEGDHTGGAMGAMMSCMMMGSGM